MTRDEVKRRLDERPFRPITVRVADDGEYQVPSGDHAHLHLNGPVLFIHLNSGGTAIIDVPLITSIHLQETV
jgi:hypothetical protein